MRLCCNLPYDRAAITSVSEHIAEEHLLRAEPEGCSSAKVLATFWANVTTAFAEGKLTDENGSQEVRVDVENEALT